MAKSPPKRIEKVRNSVVKRLLSDIYYTPDTSFFEFKPTELPNQRPFDDYRSNLVRFELFFLTVKDFSTIMGMLNVTLIGLGRVGGSLVTALLKGDVRVRQVIVRDKSRRIGEFEEQLDVLGWDDLRRIDSEVVIIATGDSEIAGVDARLADLEGLSGSVVLHTSGLLSSDVLARSREVGAFVGSMHPLASFPDAVSGWANFDGASFCLEGDAKAVAVAEEMVELLGGESFTVPSEFKALYHAAAVMACGNLVALLSESVRMLKRCGLSEEDALKRLRPLVMGTVSNVFTNGPAESLTGPFARLDVDAATKDLEAVESMDDRALTEIFVGLGRLSVHIASQNGGDIQKVGRMLQEIRMEK